MTQESTRKPFTVHDMHPSERPRERLLTHGAQALSNAELLAIILRTGTSGENVLHLAEKILNTCGGLAGIARVSQHDLSQIPGMGMGKTSQVLAVIELAKRLMTLPGSERPLISRAEDAAHLVIDMRLLLQENVRVILLDSTRHLMSIQTVYVGTLNASVIRVSEIFREAITRNSPSMILVHNHPSGDPNPSPEDVELTRTLVAAGNLLDVQILDHIIVGQDDWISLKNMGIVFKN